MSIVNGACYGRLVGPQYKRRETDDKAIALNDADIYSINTKL